jgi:Tetrapyrrole (Corrin/Porphyrin) Methylases
MEEAPLVAGSEAPPEEVPSNAHADLYVVGAGVAFPDQLTIETVEILSRCKEIYTNMRDFQLNALPQELRSKCVSIWSLYRDERDRALNYKDVTDAIIDRATLVRPFGWMTPGHPLVFDSVSQALRKIGEERGWRVHVVPGISCLDSIFVDIGFDPADGLLVYEANALVKRNVPLLPDLAALLLQPAAFGTDRAQFSPTWRPDLVPLRDYICQFHASDHECALVSSSPSVGRKYKIWWSRVDELESIPTEALHTSTLFIPPAGRSFSRSAR